MAEFLTREEIRVYYDRLLQKPGYIKTLKNSIDEAKREQVLNYAREVYMESLIRIERENSIFHPIAPYNFPPCPLFTDLFVLPNGIKLDSFTYQDQLKYWLMTSQTVINLLDEKKDRRRKTEFGKNLRLADVLIEGESAEEVKSYYNFKKHKKIYLGRFLRILQSMGYFTHALKSQHFQAIGRNDFDDPTYQDRNEYKAPEINDLYRYPEFKNIPSPKKFRTSF